MKGWSISSTEQQPRFITAFTGYVDAKKALADKFKQQKYWALSLIQALSLFSYLSELCQRERGNQGWENMYWRN